MSKHSKVIKEIKILSGNSKANILEVDITYQIGGMNYFSGGSEPRGLYLGCSPIEKGDGWRGFVGFSGTKVFVKDMKRFNAKTLAEYTPSDEDVQKLIDHVVNKNELVLES